MTTAVVDGMFSIAKIAGFDISNMKVEEYANRYGTDGRVELENFIPDLFKNQKKPISDAEPSAINTLANGQQTVARALCEAWNNQHKK